MLKAQVEGNKNSPEGCLKRSLFILFCASLLHPMTEGGKKAIEKTGDHNWDMERMQSEKDQGNISSGRDYVDMNSKVEDVKVALGNTRRTMDK